MKLDVKVPVLPESITDATLLQWRKKAGEFVRRDEILIELETDKVVLEITAPADGVLAEIRKPNGTSVLSDEVIAVVDSEAQAGIQNVSPTPVKTPATTTAKSAKSATPELSPAVRKIAAEHNLNTANIPGTGKGGRITKVDALAELQAPAASSNLPPLSLSGDRPEQRVPMTRLRKRIAERLKEAQNTAASLTTFNEVNMHAVMELRNKYKDKFEKTYNVKLGFMSFFVKAAIEALKRYPIVNASIDNDDIVYHGFFDLGIAVSTSRGLVVPIMRNADTLNMAEIESTIAQFGAKARDGKLSMEELTGGTFTISNGGIFGSLLSTPILNPPQSAILGMHKIQERPVVENGQIVARPMMYVALSYDHRIIDGQEAVLFLAAMKDAIEDPSRLLLQV
ncbi:MAG: 2-oxoglutarate dehydrogenase complex dihydrolipoyllysine-residue succinyltransferase [Gammaproteobacteria bacterium]|nr:2-oxoglutarate dehydrogenase complex dihydrolipoyllysine-residue succinyltransferase [Gammaproteobacteria bacterium]